MNEPDYSLPESEGNGFMGVMVYARTRAQALAKVEALALRVIADRLEHIEQWTQR